MPAAGMRLEHRIEAGHLVDLDGRQTQVLGHAVHELGREEALVLFLRETQRREHGRTMTPRGEPADPFVDLVTGVLIEQAGLFAQHRLEGAAVRRLHNMCAHRSTSPNTMSCVPITATTSASMCPLVISSNADRCAKPGARHLRR